MADQFAKQVELELRLWDCAEKLVNAFRARGLSNEAILAHMERIDAPGLDYIRCYLEVGL